MRLIGVYSASAEYQATNAPGPHLPFLRVTAIHFDSTAEIHPGVAR